MVAVLYTYTTPCGRYFTTVFRHSGTKINAAAPGRIDEPLTSLVALRNAILAISLRNPQRNLYKEAPSN